MVGIALLVHVLSAVIWVGGMFFAYMCLRPVAANILEPPIRLRLWQSVFSSFFKWVWLAVVMLILSGHTMIFLYGGMGNVGLHIHIMLGLGYLMIGLYFHVYFALFRKLSRAVVSEDWSSAGEKLNKIRQIIAINLSLGLIIAAIGSGGKYLFYGM